MGRESLADNVRASRGVGGDKEVSRWVRVGMSSLRMAVSRPELLSMVTENASRFMAQ